MLTLIAFEMGLIHEVRDAGCHAIDDINGLDSPGDGRVIASDCQHLGLVVYSFNQKRTFASPAGADAASDVAVSDLPAVQGLARRSRQRRTHSAA